MNSLKEFRIKAGLSLRDLAEKSGLNFTTIHELETGKRKARLVTAGKLAIALGIEWRQLTDIIDVKELDEEDRPKTKAA
jgi:transcriptional regulator with XRE-family HTH domain